VLSNFHALDTFGRDYLEQSSARRRLWLLDALTFWRRRGFPYPSLSRSELFSDFDALRRSRPDSALHGNVARTSTVGLRLANAFHPQIWSIRSHGRSALDSFNDNASLHAVLEKCARFYPDRRCWNPQCVRSVLRFHHRSRVSNFRPAVARALIHRYSRDRSVVLDFAAGFGGRLLASLSLRRSYLGIDPSVQQTVGLRRMIHALREVHDGDASIVSACAEDVLPNMPSQSVDLILSSPPYFDTEKYESSLNQSCYRYPTYAEWKEKFLSAVIAHGCRLLRRGGVFLLNLKDRPGLRLARDAFGLFPQGFRAEPTIRLLVPSLPQVRAGGHRLYGWEPILVMRKVA
jgi:hypothetical protein